jgi:adenylate cyclase
MRLLNRGALVGAGIALLMLLVSAWDREFFGIENLLSDFMTRRVAAKVAPDPNIVIVAINDKSVHTLEASYGRFPWTRELMARVVEEAKLAGARAVVFDVSFTGSNVSDLAGDERFAKALTSMPTVIAVQTSSKPPTPIPAAVATKLIDLPPRATDPQMLLIAPAKEFNATGLGTIRYDSSRRYLALDRVGPRLYVPSLAVAAARAATGQPALSWSDGTRFLNLGATRIPVDDTRRFAIRWHGAKVRATQISYPVIDFDKVILASMARESPGELPEVAAALPQFSKQLQGKILIVGATAQGLLDLRSTPLSPTSAGVEIHANALDNLLHGDFNREASLILVGLLMLLIAAAFGGFMFVTESYIGEFAFFAGTTIAWLAGTYLALTQRIIVPAVPAIFTFILTYAVITLAEYVAEKRRGVQLKATFGRYVSPQILDHILAHPEKVELGGERRDMTILFSDIRGFTSISEASEPEEVVEMLNEYLTEMVEILLRHGGTLDKFIGDAVMGFWNAPTADEHHAEHAVACAVEMIEATTRIRERWEPEGKASIRIGIGINSGDAVVGNIGSKQVFGYTVIGDAVNLASRLESKNKDYGTEIIISEMTLQRISAGYETRYLDEVKVKGKEKAVKIYEVKGRTA